jgi:signal transduction histidine kinase
MRRSLLFWIGWLLSLSATAQPAYTERDSIAIYQLLDQADELDFAGLQEDALKTVREALRLSREKKMLRGEGFANLKMADLFLKKSDYAQLESHYKEGEHIGNLLRDSFILGLTFHQRAQYTLITNKLDETIRYLNKALGFYSETNHTLYVAGVANELGFVQEKKGLYTEATAAYLKAVRLFERIESEKELANTLNNLAIVYYRLNEKEECLRRFKQCLAIQQRIGDVKRMAATAGNIVTVYTPINLDSALHYQNIALEYAKRSGLLPAQAQAYQNQAALLKRANRFEEALESEKNAIALLEQIGDQGKLAARYTQVADIYRQMQDSVKAATWYGKAEQLARQLNQKPLLQDVFLAKSNFYKSWNDFPSAYEYLRLFQTYKDSILDETTKASISELQIQYETEKKDLQLAQLEAEQKQKELEIDRQKKQLEINALLNAQKDNEITLLRQEGEIQRTNLVKIRLEQKNQELVNKTNTQSLALARQKVSLLKKDQLLKEKQLQRERSIRWTIGMGGLTILLVSFLVFSRMQLKRRIMHQNALFEVRNNIAKDLHDEIGSTLTSINILSVISEKSLAQAPEKTQHMLEQISAQSRAIQQKMSDIVWAIRPDSEKIEALSARMREFAAKTLEPKGISIQFDVEETMMAKSLSLESRKEVLLIFKEAIHNIIKHAGATQVSVRWVRTTNRYLLDIADNGTWKGSPESTGTGLRSMRERALVIGGSLRVEPGPSGTRIALEIPIA